ncbi:hypothetical protein F1880_006614 [Penicillium rolfsii]|nr:hypothetical protein F1880_006614 [Penicillium rolfsii]
MDESIKTARKSSQHPLFHSMSARSWLRMIPRKSFFDTLYYSNSVNHARNEFLTSRSAEIVNPRHHMVLSDAVWQDFDAETLAGMTDATILSSFTSGFFGGFVFSIEGVVLSAGAWRLLPVHFTNFSQNPQALELWRSSEVPADKLCDVGTRLFGVFQVLDKYVAESSDNQMSYVDYGFGSDNDSFAGCHRFSVTRSPGTSETISGIAQPKTQIRISLEALTCDPQMDKSPVRERTKWFHALYSRALHANGVQAVLESSRMK